MTTLGDDEIRTIAADDHLEYEADSDGDDTADADDTDADADDTDADADDTDADADDTDAS